MADAEEAMGSLDRDDLARTISVAGLSISQAADELQQAAERLSAAEERARPVDARDTAAEEQLGAQAARDAEMLSLLQHAREAQTDAEERARESEQATQREAGMHVVTANKGPVVHGYRKLTDLAKARGVRFFFESAVMDGAPIFSLFRETLPAARLRSFHGVLNSTTNMILTRMEQGESFNQAVAYCQQIGIAETDPSGDIDGWDASVKVSALATVLMYSIEAA